MPRPPEDSPLRHLAEPAPPGPAAWLWAVAQPEATGRLRLNAAAKALIGFRDGDTVGVRGRCHRVGLVLRPAEPTGALLRVDGRGRLTLPMSLRDRGPFLVGTNTTAGVIVIAPIAVLDHIGDVLAGGMR